MDRQTERRILASPGTRRMVHEILALAEQRDPCDVVADAECALAILIARRNRMLGRAS